MSIIDVMFMSQGFAMPGSTLRLRLFVYNGMGYQDQDIKID